MADNLAVTPGTGATMGADELTDGTLGSVKVPYAKIMDGTLDSSNKLTITSGGAALVDGTATTQPVSAVSLPLPSGAATSANQSTGNTSLSNIDGKLTAGHGTAAAAVRVELPTDGTGVVGLNAGTNAIGKLAANSGVTIGAVEIASSQTLATVTNVATIGTSVTPGTSAAHLGKAEDAAHTSGDTGVMSLGVRNDTLATLTSNDGDYGAIAVSKSGRLLVTPAPSDAYVFGNASVAGTGDTSVVAAAGVGLKNYITNLSIANTGSSATLITLKDGNAGSTLWYTIAPAGGGSNIQLEVPIVTTANTALYFACGTSSTTVYVSAAGYKAP